MILSMKNVSHDHVARFWSHGLGSCLKSYLSSPSDHPTMPAPTKNPENGDPFASTSTATSQPSQKSMTKAERRDLQEKQRAAKLLQKEQQQKPGGPAAATATGSTSKAKPLPAIPNAQKRPQSAAPAGRSSDAHVGRSQDAASKDSASAACADDTSEKSRGLRIFSHFGLPKPQGHVVKGDIHPAIVRLGLQFSEFKICGANARCIATLTAFQTASVPFFFVSGSFAFLIVMGLGGYGCW